MAKKDGLLLIDPLDKDTKKRITIAAKLLETIDPELAQKVREKAAGEVTTEY